MVNPSPSVPFGKVWKGLAQADWAAFDGEKVEPLAELEVDVIETVELEDEKLDVVENVHELEDIDELEDEMAEEVDVDSDVDVVIVGFRRRLTLLELVT